MQGIWELHQAGMSGIALCIHFDQISKLFPFMLSKGTMSSQNGTFITTTYQFQTSLEFQFVIDLIPFASLQNAKLLNKVLNICSENAFSHVLLLFVAILTYSLKSMNHSFAFAPWNGPKGPMIANLILCTNEKALAF